MQGCLEFPSLVVPDDLNEENVASLRITIYDAPRQMLYYNVFYTWYV